MSRLEEIKNEVAQERGFKDWEELNGSDLYDSDIEKVSIKYAKECSQASLDKASENTIQFIDSYPAELSEIKLQIIDPENIILL